MHLPKAWLWEFGRTWEILVSSCVISKGLSGHHCLKPRFWLGIARKGWNGSGPIFELDFTLWVGTKLGFEGSGDRCFSAGDRSFPLTHSSLPFPWPPPWPWVNYEVDLSFPSCWWLEGSYKPVKDYSSKFKNLLTLKWPLRLYWSLSLYLQVLLKTHLPLPIPHLLLQFLSVKPWTNF